MRARPPAVGLAIPNLDSTQVLGPGGIKALPRFSPGRVRQHRHAASFPKRREHGSGRQVLAQEWHIPPGEDMNDIVRVAIFDPGDHQDLVGADLATCRPVLNPLRLREAAIMLGHQHHVVTTPAELRRQLVERPFAVVRPDRVHVGGRDDPHGSARFLHQVIEHRVHAIGDEDPFVVAPPIVERLIAAHMHDV